MSETDRPNDLALSGALDLGAAGPLREALLARRGGPLTLEVSGVQRAGGLCLQVLLAARQTWAADGFAFNFTGASPPLREAFTIIGAEDVAAELAEETVP